MALIKNLTLDSGIELTEAYIKIISVTYISGYHTVIHLAIFKDKNARINNKAEIIKIKHNCTSIEEFNQFFSIEVLNETDKNILSQAYEWLKTLTPYQDAIDDFDMKE